MDHEYRVGAPHLKDSSSNYGSYMKISASDQTRCMQYTRAEYSNMKSDMKYACMCMCDHSIRLSVCMHVKINCLFRNTRKNLQLKTKFNILHKFTTELLSVNLS